MTRADPCAYTLAGQVEVTLVRNAQDEPCLTGTAVTYTMPLRALA
jgi:hypothetical protein